MLGYGVNLFSFPQKITPHILKHKCFGTFAYVVPHRTMSKILQKPTYQGDAIDSYYQEFNQYLYYPIQMVTTLQNGSDVSKMGGLNHFFNWCVPNRIIVLNDLQAKFIYYHFYFRLLIGLLFLIFLRTLK